jgi:hypothetical protein
VAARYVSEVFADYFQIWIVCEQARNSEHSFLFSGQHLSNRVWTDPGLIIMFTERNMTVPVVVEVQDSKPENDFAEWDHVTEASLDVPSGIIEMEGCGGHNPMQVQVKSGLYRVRMYQTGLGMLSENGLEGNDHYKIVLWPDVLIPPTVLKKWEPN